MAGRSSLLVILLVMGVLFSLLYVSSIRSANETITHDAHLIPTQPKISQLQALETVENHIRSNVKGVEKISLYFSSYNFSRLGYNQNLSGGELTNLGWNLEYVKSHPKLLSLPLAFVHANGTVYGVNVTSHSYVRACHITQFPPYEGCPMGEIAAYAARDRLVYHVETYWSPSLPQDPFIEGHHIVDAETGEIVWNNIDYAMENRPLPMPNVNFDNKTVSQLNKELANPPRTTNVDIEYGAADKSTHKDYLPKEVRVNLGIDNRVVWTNRDAVPQTVVSDSGYVDKLTGKKLDSGLILPNSTFEFTFTKAGEYTYHAEAHPWMTGKVYLIENFS